MKEDKIVNWYNQEIRKDELEIKTHKANFIKKIRKIDKNIIKNNKQGKTTLWNKLKKILSTLKIVQK